ncbi:MAG TPA: ABC transporter permease [Gemmatimonadetes bacterium]|nr:ABC transporter permease [Gemmatimonadota bacterium]
MSPLLYPNHRDRLHWFIARHYLGAGRGRGLLSLITWISLGGVIVGVTALVVVIGVMSGMQEDLQAKILESTPHIIVLESGTTLRLHEWEEVVDLVMEVDEVVGAAPFVLSQVSVARTGTDGLYPQSANLYGIAIDTGRVAPTEMERQIIEGAYNLEPPESGLSPLLMGVGLADRMQLFEGDTLLVVSFENLKMDIMGGLNPTMRQFEVTGVFTTGMYDYDMQNVYTTLEAAQELVGITNSGVVSGVGVRTTRPELANEVRGKIQELLGFPFYAESWMTTNRALFSALRLEKIAMGLILGLIVLVAAFNIVSTLVMVVADRTREIGILKAMGMTRRGIMRVFVLQGAWIGVAGTFVGTVCGVSAAVLIERFEIIRIPPDVYFVDHLPVSLRVLDVLGIVIASVTISFVATIYPAWKASRLEPVDAIRHE